MHHDVSWHSTVWHVVYAVNAVYVAYSVQYGIPTTEARELFGFLQDREGEDFAAKAGMSVHTLRIMLILVCRGV